MNWARHFVFYRSLELEGNHWWLVRAKAKIGSKRAVQFRHFHFVVGITLTQPLTFIWLTFILPSIYLCPTRGKMANTEEKKKKKRPSAEKRETQNQKRRLQNRVFTSSVRTTQRTFNEALKARDKESIQETFSKVYSMIDKGVKRGLISGNKASRAKAKAAAQVAAQAS